jgi:uncharacterized protein (DUF1330 family)
MNSTSKLLALAAASMAVGVAGGTFLHAQTAAPPAYLIAELQVTDAEVFKQYLAALPATFAPYKVKTLARGTPVSLDGSTPPAGAVAVFAFNSMDDIKAFWNSPAYQAIIPLRDKSSKSRIYAIPGAPPS